MMALLLVLLAVCLLGLRLSYGPLQIPDLASWLATAASGEGISVRMQEADLGWAGYHQGGGVPLYLRLGDIDVRNAVGVELVHIPSARLEVLPAALFGASAPIMVSGTDARFPGSAVPVSLLAAIRLGPDFSLARADMSVTLGAGAAGCRGEQRADHGRRVYFGGDAERRAADQWASGAGACRPQHAASRVHRCGATGGSLAGQHQRYGGCGAGAGPRRVLAARGGATDAQMGDGEYH